MVPCEKCLYGECIRDIYTLDQFGTGKSSEYQSFCVIVAMHAGDKFAIQVIWHAITSEFLLYHSGQLGAKKKFVHDGDGISLVNMIDNNGNVDDTKWNGRVSGVRIECFHSNFLWTVRGVDTLVGFQGTDLCCTRHDVVVYCGFSFGGCHEHVAIWNDYC